MLSNLPLTPKNLLDMTDMNTLKKKKHTWNLFVLMMFENFKKSSCFLPFFFFYKKTLQVTRNKTSETDFHFSFTLDIHKYSPTLLSPSHSSTLKKVSFRQNALWIFCTQTIFIHSFSRIILVLLKIVPLRHWWCCHTLKFCNLGMNYRISNLNLAT